jgi:hypothetical protein
MGKHEWYLIGEELDFVEGLSWCPHCGTTRLKSRKEPGVYMYWFPGMDVSKPVPEEEPPCVAGTGSTGEEQL